MNWGGNLIFAVAALVGAGDAVVPTEAVFVEDGPEEAEAKG